MCDCKEQLKRIETKLNIITKMLGGAGNDGSNDGAFIPGKGIKPPKKPKI